MVLLEKIYEKKSIRRLGEKSPEYKVRQRNQMMFIIRSHFSRSTEKRYLGYVWLVLNPLVISLIYLFVFTVVRARIGTASIFIGITLYQVLQESVKNGINIVKSPNGGIKCEKVDSEVIIKATILRRSIESALGTIPTSLILIYGLGVSIQGGLIYVLIAQIMSLSFFGLGLCVAGTVRKIPDLGEVIGWILRLGFFASPAIYPMYKMEGLHYKINQYNPFTYFAESSRYFADENSVVTELNPLAISGIIGVIIILNIWAIRRFDRLRWRITVWS